MAPKRSTLEHDLPTISEPPSRVNRRLPLYYLALLRDVGQLSVRRFFLETFRKWHFEILVRRGSVDAFLKWLDKEVSKVPYPDRYSLDDVMGYFRALDNLKLPSSFRGRVKGPRRSSLPVGIGLLREYETLVRTFREQVISEPNRFMAMLEAFPELPPEVRGRILDSPGRADARRFAKEVLAERYDSTIRNVETALRDARSRPHSLPS